MSADDGDPWAGKPVALSWKPYDWRDRFPNFIMDPCDPHGVPLETARDFRVLHWLEGVLNGAGSPELRDVGRAVKSYLNETCQHHWTAYAGDEDIAAHRQCLWCCDVEWAADARPPEPEEQPIPGQQELFDLGFGDGETRDADDTGVPIIRSIDTGDLL